MLMTIDVGNTNIAVGIYENEELKTVFRMTTKAVRTSDEIAGELSMILRVHGLRLYDIDEVILSSVVPDINHALINVVRKYIGVEPMIVSLRLKTGIKADIPDLGADRIVDCAAAHAFYGPEVLVIDFGTATTYDFIDAEGKFITGITAPGLRIEAEALSNMAAQLPAIELKYPESVVTTDTVTSMQIGVVYGYIGSVEYIIKAIRDKVGHDFKVVATGGLGSMVCPYTKMIDVYDKDLAYKGMKLIRDLNR